MNLFAQLRRTIANRLSWDNTDVSASITTPANFILTPPRSGSTLLRVMLAGNPALFAPPELELLAFSNLNNRQIGLSIRHRHILTGLVRAVMALRQCSEAEAAKIIREWELQATSTPEVYAQLQSWCGSRNLVDKSVHYALSPRIMRRAEAWFTQARYIHLIRHPQATLQSIVSSKMDKELFAGISIASRTEIAEAIWTISHQNILSFLAEVPTERKLGVRFEDLVCHPETELKRICAFLGVDFHSDMLLPYQEQQQRMTDVTGPQDPDFHRHSGIDAKFATAWRKQESLPVLLPETIDLANSFDYWDLGDSQADESSSLTRWYGQHHRFNDTEVSHHEMAFPVNDYFNEENLVVRLVTAFCIYLRVICQTPTIKFFFEETLFINKNRKKSIFPLSLQWYDDEKIAQLQERIQELIRRPLGDLHSSSLMQPSLSSINALLEISNVDENPVVLKDDGYSNYAMAIHCCYSEKKHLLSCRFTLNKVLFSTDLIPLVLQHWRQVFSCFDNDNQYLNEVTLFSKYDQFLLNKFNKTDADVPKNKTLIDRFEQHVEQTPDQIAVVLDKVVLTYQQLNEKANQVAHFLHNHPSLKDTHNPLIALCVERSLEMVVGMIGILKSGAAYIPIEPSLPDARIQFLLQDSQADFLLTQNYLKARFVSFFPDSSIVNLDTMELAEQPISNVRLRCKAYDLAYVIYTSGSTGQPKGVMITHHSLVNYLYWMQEQFDFTEKDKILQQTSFSFDASVWEFYVPLCIGATLVLMQPEKHADIRYIYQLLKMHKISVLQMVPSMWINFLAEYPLDATALRYIFSGGEALSTEVIKKFYAQPCSSRMEFYNLYGPTEATIYTSYWHCQNTSTICIGKPIINTRFYILNAKYQPLPFGVPGELCIAGDSLARGYLNRLELTKEKFFHVELNGKREFIYKTGDLVRWLPDGNLEYLGRMDHQVKLRGFRIELGEIESLLVQHEVVKQAVVVSFVRESNQYLHAYVTPFQEQFNVTDELTEWLKTRLPHYMVPAFFTMLDELPLTANGKMDRKALENRAIEDSMIRDTIHFVAPRNAQELALAEIWANILGVDQVGIHDNFFALGGHSLMATQVVARIRTLLELELPIKALFDVPTIAELNDYLQQNEPTSSIVLPKVIQDKAARYQPFPLTQVQQAYWLGRSDAFAMGNVAPHRYMEIDCPTFDVLRLQQAWQQLVERHEMLRTIVLADGQQQILPSVLAYTINVLDLSQEPEYAQQAKLMQIRQTMSEHMFDVAQWPLFDIRVSRINADKMRLHFSIDFLAVDGWSIAILEREWWQLYQDSKTSLPPLSLSFRDYVLAEQAWQQQATYQNALNYWHQRLDALPTAPQLPLACQPESLDQPRFKSRSMNLNAAQWQRFQQKAAQLGVTASTLLLTAFSDILSLWSKSAHFTLNLTLFNRLPVHEQINDIVGDFTSLVLLEVATQQRLPFGQRAKKIQKQLWQDLEHSYVSGVHVMREIAAHNKERAIAMPVVFTSMLSLDLKKDQRLFHNLGKPGFRVGSTPQVWLDHVVTESDEGLLLLWHSVDELFHDGMLDDMFAAYCQHIEHLMDDVNAWQATQLSHLVPVTHTAIQREANTTQVPESPLFMHDLFIQQVAKQPGQIALISGDVEFSYASLHAEAMKIGHWLRQQQVQRNQLVSVVMDKGWEQVVAVMGILYAGAAYVPIDAELPEQRQHLLLAETNTQIVLTQCRWRDTLNFPDGVQILAIDQNDLPACHELPVPAGRNLSDIAYVIYTSGSTGKPKGVVIEHRGAVNTLVDVNRRFKVSAQDRVLALSALNFDLSVYDIFGILGAGGGIVMPDSNHSRDPQHWAQLMVQHQVTLWNTVPALMQMLLDYQNGQVLDTPLRISMMSGDWISLTLPNRIKQLWPNCQTYSFGGATEASIWSIYYPIGCVNLEQNSIPYGKPLDNQTFYVLDEHLESRPIWTPGDLYIGGIGLAKGYWRDEAKTATSFIIHPQTGERLYKTGDLGRWLPDGNIEFMGREDTQVKVYGHRIELGDIETHLSRHPKIKECVVLALGEALQEKQLVAYVVPRAEKTVISVEDYGRESMRGQLTDPIERTAFKFSQLGIRQFARTTQDVALPRVELDQSAYLHRQSYREFIDAPVPLAALSQMLACLQPMRFPQAPLPKYRYGSAGSLYPIQTYVYIRPERVQGLAAGLYYYHPLEHGLMLISDCIEMGTHFYGGINEAIFKQSAFSLFLVSQMQAIEPMYGQMSRDFCLIEAGYMSHLLMEEAHQYDIGLCPIGGMQFEPIKAEFALDEGQEMLHSFMGGAITAEQKKRLPIAHKPQAAAKTTSDANLVDSLKAFLYQAVPHYMVPNHYIALEKMPLNANGKVDRKALPAPDLSQARVNRVQPANEIEQQLLDIVASILSVETLGVTDHFFEVGANSLEFIQIFNQIKKHWQIEISVIDVFRHANVREIAQLIKTQLDNLGAVEFEEIEL